MLNGHFLSVELWLFGPKREHQKSCFGSYKTWTKDTCFDLMIHQAQLFYVCFYSWGQVSVFHFGFIEKKLTLSIDGRKLMSKNWECLKLYIRLSHFQHKIGAFLYKTVQLVCLVCPYFRQIVFFIRGRLSENQTSLDFRHLLY